MNKTLKVKCPQCEKEFLYYSSEFRPFCSERCQQIDLGHWFQESYVVPSKDLNVDAEKEVDEENDEKNESEYDH